MKKRTSVFNRRKKERGRRVTQEAHLDPAHREEGLLGTLNLRDELGDLLVGEANLQAENEIEPRDES